MSNETGWDIMSGTAIEKPIQKIIISSRNLSKLEFDELIKMIEIAGKDKIKKYHSGFRPDDNFECIFKVINHENHSLPR